MIVTRYIASEIIKSTVAVILVLLLIGLSNDFVLYLAKAAAGELPAGFVLKITLYNMPLLLGLVIPLGFFLGILLSLGRLYADAEMTALLACGLSMKRLLATVLGISVGFAVLTFTLYLWGIPASTALQETLIAEGEADWISRSLVSGQFQTFNGGDTVVFAEEVASDTRILGNVFIAQMAESSVTVSQKGYEMREPGTLANYVVLADGTRYTGKPGEPDFVISSFGEFGFLLKPSTFKVSADLAALPTSQLWGTEDLYEWVELQWRMTLPLAVFVVGFLAVPLSRVNPRQGKYANLLPALIVIILYCNALVLGRVWLQEGNVPRALGFWWIHGVALVTAFLLLAFQRGMLRRWMLWK